MSLPRTRASARTLAWRQITSFPFSRGFLDHVKDIMGQIETMWWGGSEPLCGYACGWLIDEMLSLRRGSMMMAISRGWELRRLLLLGIQARVLTALLLKFVFLLFGQVVSACDGYCLLLYLMYKSLTFLFVISPQQECNSSEHSLHCFPQMFPL